MYSQNKSTFSSLTFTYLHCKVALLQDDLGCRREISTILILCQAYNLKKNNLCFQLHLSSLTGFTYSFLFRWFINNFNIVFFRKKPYLKKLHFPQLFLLLSVHHVQMPYLKKILWKWIKLCFILPNKWIMMACFE